MVDPVTVGSLVAGALGMAADALKRAVKDAAGEAIMEGYHALKDKVSHWASGDDVAALEAAPSSKARQAVVAEIIDAQSDDDKEALRILAETLIAKLTDSAPTIGLDIGRLTDLETQLGNITATGGIGARIGEAKGGTIKVGDISVGNRSEK
jgi:hypothetical protein